MQKARTQLTKTWIENLEADFGNLAKPKKDFAEERNFDESKLIQTKGTTKNLEAKFRNPAKPKIDFAKGMNFAQSKLLQTEALT